MSEIVEPKIDWDLRCRPTLPAVAPRLAPSWRGYFRIAEDGTRSVSTNATVNAEWGGILPGTLYDRPDDDPTAAAARTPADAVALLDRHALECAVLDPGIAGRLSGLASTRWAADLAKAVNDWLVEEWLPADDRLRAAIVVGPRNAAMAAAEIRRLGARERVARVSLAYPPALLGDRSLHPIFEAAEEVGLPVHLHAGGAWTGANAGLTGAGDPGSAFEAGANWVAAAQPHLASLLSQGVFERFPGLRVVLGGFGVAWLPSLLWRMDADYHAGAALAPARVRRAPSADVREHVRFCTAGVERPAGAVGLFALLDLIDARSLLVFGSGLAGLDAEATQDVLGALPDEWRTPVLRENALGLVPDLAAAPR